ncbi:MAG: N-acetyltransferase [Clostridiales bacterium]|nr:N-acetyltransferase [Clostridiales bacterium]
MNIRLATVADAPQLLAIYAPYIEETAITYEYTVPSVAEFAARIENTLKKYPYLVLEDEGEIRGYAYASPFRTRAAYAWCVETSIYLRKDCRKKGYGKALLQKLEKLLKEQNVLSVYACISFAEEENEILTHASIHFHEKMGYAHAARVHQCGYKFERWFDLVIMEKMLGEHTKKPAPLKKPADHI